MINRTLKLAFIIVFFVPILLCSNVVCDVVLSDEWMDIYFLGSKMGKMNIKTIKTNHEGKQIIVTKTTENTYGIRGDSNITSEIQTIEYEDENCKPMLIKIKMKISKISTTMTCVFIKDKIKIKVNTLEKITEKELTNTKDILLTWGLRQKMLSKGFGAGTKYTNRVFSPENFSFWNTTVEVIGKESIDYYGKSIKVNKIKSLIKEINLECFDYVDDDGTTYKGEIPMIGLTFLKTKNSKISYGEFNKSNDITRTNIRPIGNVQKLSGIYQKKRCKFLISSNKLNLDEIIPESNWQKLKLDDNQNGKIILVSTKNLKHNFELKKPFEKNKWLKYFDKKSAKSEIFHWEKFQNYLIDSPFIQSKNEKIKNKANEIVGNENELIECSKLLCDWINKNLKNKNYNVIWASALEVLENLEGDCSEHALLFIALARSIGIPSRGVLGLVYSDKDNEFAFHVWCEVFAGEWIPLDPALGFDYKTPAHIELIKTDMNDLGLSDQVVNLFKIIQDFRIEIP